MQLDQQTPLAESMRPVHLNDYAGQKHLVGKDAILRKSIDSGNIHSMILWGPPGVGKTTLAYVISQQLLVPFYSLSAINSGVSEVRKVIEKARASGNRSILFIDEIHRFSKSQQDSLLGAVEKGIVTLIGATTENPSFEVISPLLSRCQVYILKPLEKNDLIILLEKGKNKLEKELSLEIDLLETDAMLRISGGDARKLYNALELIATSLNDNNKIIKIDNKSTLQAIQQNIRVYDKNGEMHYDIISAFIKSMRGSDPNATVYWLARMLEGGEEIKFIARRMLILASEDIGNANPNALVIANSCFDAIDKIGMPEARLILSQTAIYLASSPKSNASYFAIKKAQKLVKNTGDLSVPLAMRNAPTKLMKDIGYGKDYKYAHDYKDDFIDIEFLPDEISGTKLYNPKNNKWENEIRKHLKKLWKEKYDY